MGGLQWLLDYRGKVCGMAAWPWTVVGESQRGWLMGVEGKEGGGCVEGLRDSGMVEAHPWLG